MQQKQLRLANRHTLITVLEEDVSEFIQATKYGRNKKWFDYRNGYYEHDLVTMAGKIEDLQVPRTQEGFQTKLF